MKFSSYLVFTLLWTTFVYDPVAHWVWSPGGWIRQLGALDFAGGLVVHLTSGLAALCARWCWASGRDSTTKTCTRTT